MPRQFYYECQCHHFNANASGVKAMLELNPTVAVLEPTGVNYARLWGWLAGERSSVRYDTMY
ncbi:hypothetical protein [Nostoc sp. FACHB-280]|uniref:hypothetical protein n=1 Tax=Nostoc sp. FACHB-280 TaxID=2692839 RepID=UPI001F5542A5|nr:hypothetical protein [Nostoc sp. FACHB-280]